MERDPAVTVIIPFYNGMRTVQRALDSLERQTRPVDEVVLVDDGSAEPFRPGAVRCSLPLRVVRHEQNRGIPAARNSGVEAARGEWIGFLDQDDEWAPGKLERQWRVVEREGRDADVVVFGRLLMETGEGRPHLRPPTRAIPAIEAGGWRTMGAFLRHGNVVPMVTVLTRRALLLRHGGFDESLRGGADDTELVLRLAGEGVRFRLDDEPGRGRWSVAHRHTGRNYSDHAPRWIQDQLRFIPRLARRYPAMAALEDAFLARSYFTLGRHHDRAGDRERAGAAYRRARRLDPGWWKPRAAVIWLSLPTVVRGVAGRAWAWLKERRSAGIDGPG